MHLTDFRFTHRLRVRWSEIDAQKIVFNAHYLQYADTAIAAYWRALALPYETTMHALGGDLFVKKAELEYHASARMDELLDIGLRCARIGSSSMVFEVGVFRGNARLVSGQLVYVFCDPVHQRPQPVPQPLRDTLLGFEAGEPVFTVRTGDWEAVGKAAWDLRVRVFVDEQGIPADREWDGADAEAVHAVGFNRLDRPVATARLLQPEPGVGQIGRMAVDPVLRGTRFGAQVLQALLDAARARGDREVFLHAQQSAAGFYTRAGFVPRGPAFEEVGIAHQEMVRRLV